MFVRNSGAGNGRAKFMGASKNAFFLQEKKPMSIKFLLLGGGGILGLGGGMPILLRESFSQLTSLTFAQLELCLDAWLKLLSLPCKSLRP